MRTGNERELLFSRRGISTKKREKKNKTNIAIVHFFGYGLYNITQRTSDNLSVKFSSITSMIIRDVDTVCHRCKSNVNKAERARVRAR